MKNESREVLDAYMARLATLNGVRSAERQFTVTPSVQQKLETKIQESSAFLSKINMVPVTEMAGEKLGLGVSGPIASTTDTNTQERVTTDLSTFDANGYLCTKTDFDTHIGYGKIDMWAKFPDFQTRLRNSLVTQQGLDRIMIGFNGTSRAATSNKSTNPLLQDVNKGWLQKYREFAPARVLKEVAAASNKVQIGSAVTTANGYKNLDALVFDVVGNLIDPWFRENPALVVVMGRQLLADKYFPLVNANLVPSETMAADMIISQKRVGGLAAVSVPFVPANTLLVTTLDNLSIYWQEGARRRAIIDKPSRDRIENFESSNEAYVVEDYGRGCVVENIEIVA